MPKGDGADPFSGLHCRFQATESLPHTIPAEVLALPADGDEVVALGIAGSVVVRAGVGVIQTVHHLGGTVGIRSIGSHRLRNEPHSRAQAHH